MNKRSDNMKVDTNDQHIEVKLLNYYGTGF